MKFCYANTLGDCSQQMSGEHIISKSILEIGQPDIGRVQLGGPFDRVKPRASRNLAKRKILCTKHNSELSIVDDEMTRLAKEIFEWNQHQTSKELKFNGPLLTRWLMKYASGMLFGNVTNAIAPMNIASEEWLQILFGKLPFPDWLGFETSGPKELLTAKVMEKGGMPPFACSLLQNQNMVAVGAQIGLYPIEIFSLFGSGISQHSNSFRIGTIKLQALQDKAVLTLIIDWPNGGDRAFAIKCRAS